MRYLLNYLKLIRIHHYLKNILVFLAIIFSGNLIQGEMVFKSIMGFLAFCFSASIVYIFNDIKDIEKDRSHPIKRNRPLAANTITIPQANITIVFLVLGIIIFLISGKILNYKAIVILSLYIIINIFYSMGLKEIPLVDIFILVFGFLLRVIFGSIIINTPISGWLYLTVMSISFFLGLGKRRNEVKKQGTESRTVLKYYSKDFLDKNMYMFLSMTIIFYSLWCVDQWTILRLGKEVIFTIPLVIFICMKYSLNIEGDSFGDPVDVLLKDKLLCILVVMYGILSLGIIYF